MFAARFSASALGRTRHAPAAALGTVRYLNVHEYVSMEIMKQHGVKTPECYVAETPDEAEHVFETGLNKRTYFIIFQYFINWCAIFVVVDQTLTHFS